MKSKILSSNKFYNIGEMAYYDCLIHNDSYLSNKKYLNISYGFLQRRAAVAEWLTQLLDTQCPLGFLGSIPSCSVTIHSIKEAIK